MVGSDAFTRYALRKGEKLAQLIWQSGKGRLTGLWAADAAQWSSQRLSRKNRDSYERDADMLTA